jgi:hypothetical protein
MRVRSTIAVAMLLALGVSCSGNGRPTVEIYGDSLSFEASDVIADQLRGDARVSSAAIPGAAVCDLVSLLEREPQRSPDYALIQYSGNSATECMRDDSGRYLTGDDLVERYAADVERATALLRERGTHVYLVGSPRGRDDDAAVELNAAFATTADAWSARDEPVSYVDAEASVLAPDGSFTPRLPCLPFEDASRGCAPDGTIAVRSGDGVHFCPDDTGGKRDCPVWSSGAYRFATAIVGPVRDAIEDERLL